MGLSDVEWNEDQFEENSWPQFEHDSRHDEFGSIPIWFYIFGGIIATIVICIFIFVIFILCYTLIKGNRNLWFQQPFRGRFGQPTPMYSSPIGITPASYIVGSPPSNSNTLIASHYPVSFRDTHPGGQYYHPQQYQHPAQHLVPHNPHVHFSANVPTPASN